MAWHRSGWTYAGILLIEPFSEISIDVHIFSFKKLPLKMSSGKCQPFCLSFNVFNITFPPPTPVVEPLQSPSQSPPARVTFHPRCSLTVDVTLPPQLGVFPALRLSLLHCHQYLKCSTCPRSLCNKKLKCFESLRKIMLIHPRYTLHPVFLISSHSQIWVCKRVMELKH